MSDTVPHNIEAEQAALGAVFVDNKCLSDVATILTGPQMFYRASHQHIYRAMLDLRDAGMEIDWIHVAEAVRKQGNIEVCGGAEGLNAYLSEISHAVPSAYGADGYARIVRDRFVMREALHVGGEIRSMALEATRSPTEVIEILERKVVALDAANTSNLIRKMGDGADAAVAEQAERTVLRQSEGKLIDGMSSGFADMDAFTGGWKGGEFIAIGATPGEGKTSLLLEIARRNMEVEKPGAGLIISLEMREKALRFKLLCAVANVDTLQAATGGLTDAEQWEYEQAGEKIKDWPLYVVDGKRGLKMRQIRSICYQAVERFGVKWVMIDYLQYIKKARPMQERLEHVSECSHSCKMLSGELDIPVLAAVQLNLDTSRRVKKQKPGLESFRYSGEIKQDVDGAWMIHTTAFHKDKPCDVTLIAAKTRLGMTGEVAMLFDRKTGRFEPAPVGANDAAYSAYTEKEAPEIEVQSQGGVQQPQTESNLVRAVPAGADAKGRGGAAEERAVLPKQVLKPGAEDDPRKEIPKEVAQEMFKTKAEGGKAVRV